MDNHESDSDNIDNQNDSENHNPKKDENQGNNIALKEQKRINNTFTSTQSYLDQIEIDDSESSNEDKYMHKVNNCLTPLLKLFILLPGKIMRFIFQIGDFYYFLEIFSIAIEYLTIILISNYRINKYVGSIVSVLFSFLFGNPLAVVAWELFQLRWIRNKNPSQAIFNILSLDEKIENYDTYYIYIIEKGTNFVLGIILYIYIIALVNFLNSTGKLFDIMNSIVLLFIPAIKNGLIYVSLIFRLIAHVCIYIYETYMKDYFDEIKKKRRENKSENEDDSNSGQIINIPQNNNNNNDDNERRIIKYIKDPFIVAQIKTKDFFNCEENASQFTFFLVKSIIILSQLIFLIIGYCKYKVESGGIAFSFIVFLYMSLFSELISMPFFFFNIFNRWCKCIKATEGSNGEIRSNPFFNGFKHIVIICHILPTLLVCGLLIFEAKRSKDGYFAESKKDIPWDGVISGKYPYIAPMSTVKSSMCFTRIYGMSLIQIASLAAAPYYSDEENYEKLLMNSFFRDENDVIKLSFLNKTDDFPVLLKADYDNVVNNYNATVFAVRGSRTPTDWWLDVEIFVSSAMLSIARWIPFLQRTEGITAKYVTNFMTLPLTLMAKSTLTLNYTIEMSKAIDELIYLPEYQNRNILFTGHSLGGGLSKVLAHKYQFQSIAVSGPGITPIENYVLNKSRKNYKFFKSKLVDIIPDRDLVPRFEMSGGTKYRVLCSKNTGECHNKLRTLCQMGISCDDEYHSGDFCSKAFSDKEYSEMKELAHK